MAEEQRAFVFAVTFIMIFSVLISTIPIGLLGPADNPDMVTAINPNLISGFSVSETFTRDNFTATIYDYTISERDWTCIADDLSFVGWAKILIFGFLWFGAVDRVKFISEGGIDRGEKLLFSEIAEDAEDGAASYSVQFVEFGSSAGTYVIYWNTANYTNPKDSWDNDELYIIHGFGIEETAAMDIGTLLIKLLFLQIPEVPLLVNIILVVPIWASIIYIIWYIVKEMIPFL